MTMRIPLNVAPCSGDELQYIQDAINSGRLAGHNAYSTRCQSWFEENTGCVRALMTPSCTAALEIAAMLIDVNTGDEVIMPSFTFVSTANAFALRGAKIVFVDVDPVTMNIDPEAVESAITQRTKAVVAVHYAGVPCEMDRLSAIAEHHKLVLIEDAAQPHLSTFRGKPAGSFGSLAAFSFHETKNLTAGGEGGMLCINDPRLVQQAEIIREKGTNRGAFFRGEVDKYTWVGLGSSYLASELQAAYLYGQLQNATLLTSRRREIWKKYREGLDDLQKSGRILLPTPPSESEHNAHMFFLKCAEITEREALISHLSEKGICAVFHYVPLHSSPAGKRHGRFHGDDRHTTAESQRLVRLPMFSSLPDEQVDEVIREIHAFYEAC